MHIKSFKLNIISSKLLFHHFMYVDIEDIILCEFILSKCKYLNDTNNILREKIKIKTYFKTS